MKAPKLPEAERLRRHRLAFERSNREGISLAEAGKRNALEAIALRKRAIEAARAGPPVQGACRPEPAPERPAPWWQDGQYK